MCEEEEPQVDWATLTDETKNYYDQYTGEILDKDMVQKARELEIQQMLDYKVFEWCSESEVDGEIIKTKWLDHLKAVELVRSRCVGMQFATTVDFEMYAGTPPLAMIKLIISMAACRSSAGGEEYSLAIHDISVAFFHAELDCKMYARPPPEMRRPGELWRLLKALYGTRPASRLFQAEVRAMYLANGFIELSTVACLFYSAELTCLSGHHGDDFLSVGSAHALDFVDKMLDSRFSTKAQPRIGQSYSHHGQILNRTIIWSKQGFALLPDSRHIVNVSNLLKLQGVKPSPTPGSKATGKGSRTALEDLTREESQVYRSCCGILQYLAMDRVDIQYMVKVLAKDSSCPKEVSMARLRRLARYLCGTAHYGMEFKYQDTPKHITVIVDGDWSGDSVSCKSTSAGCILHGSHMLESWSVTQQVISLSSAESEFYAIGSGCSRGLTVKNVLNELAALHPGTEPIGTKVLTDSDAARGMLQRHGVGRVRHLATRFLWIQSALRDKEFDIERIEGKQNPIDIGTKVVDADNLRRSLPRLSVGSLRELGWHIPQTSLTATLFLIYGSTPAAAVTSMHDPPQCEVKVVMDSTVVDVNIAGCLAVLFSCTAIGCACLYLWKGGASPSAESGGQPTAQEEFRQTPESIGPEGDQPADSPVPAEARQATARVNRRNVVVQGPATYKWWRSQPRFEALGPRQWGAWHE